MATVLSPPLPISRSGTGLPSRVIYHGLEKIGKSSFAAQAPRPIFLMTRGETGLLTLIDTGLVEQTDHFDEVTDWNALMKCIDYLYLAETSAYKTLVIDTLNGAERLCFEYVCEKRFEGSWEKFAAYSKGPEASQEEWIKLLTTLDRLRAAKKMGVIVLTHTKVKTFKNPEGDDFDRYIPDMHEKMWGLSHKWADAILFGHFEQFAKKGKGELKAKGVNSARRLFHTERTAAWDAGNRINLPAEIDMGPDAASAWAAFSEAAKAGRKQLNGDKS
jgi:hypothetical protein